MGNTIKGNVGELFVLSTGEIKEPKNLDKFHPQSNVNILVINIEGIPQEKTMAQINFAPTNKSGWASVWFPLNRKGVLHHKLENEDEYRTFTQYTIQVPEPITTLNLNNSSALNVGITFRHIGGIDFLGAYETIQDLIAEYPPYQDLSEMLAIAYVYGTTNYGFYQVVFDNGVYVWQQTPSPIAQLQIKPYNMGNIQIQGGYGTRTPIQSIADSQYNLIWLELNTIASRLDLFYDKEHIDTAFLEKYTTPTGDNDVFSIYGITAQGQQAIYQASVKSYDNTIVVRDRVGRIKDLDEHNISSEAHSNEFNKKVDKITQAQRDSLGFMEPGDRIVYAVDGNLNEMPIRATTLKRENTIVMRGTDGTFQDLYDHNTMVGAHTYEFSKKVDKITEAQRDSLGFMEPGDRIIPGVDGNLNEMPIRATTLKRENTIVMRGTDGTFQDLYDHNTMVGAHTYEFNKKVDKTQTIIGIDLQDDILLGEFKQALGNATQSVAGLLSAEDKTHLDGLVALLETNDSNNVVDTIGEILAIFQNYPEGADLVTVLQGKVDKITGKGLSTNDFTDEYKNKVDTLDTKVDDIEDNVGEISSIVDYTQSVMQNRLVAGDNITIDNYNEYSVISASGVDLNAMAYFDYAGSIYGDKYSLLASAWEHSLTVDPLEISAESSYSNPQGTAQYPDGAIEGVIIPQGVTSIGNYAFYGWSLNNQPLVIPDSVQNIGGFAFAGWSSNNQLLVIPNSVTSISDYAFDGWTSNNQPLVIPNSVTSIGEAAFYEWTANNQPLVIPNSVTSISDYAFYEWTSNNQPLVIPNSVISIGGEAFSRWLSNNQPLMISNSVTSIGYATFQGWSSNNHPLVIPNSVTSIGMAAFDGWSSVPYVEIKATTPPTLVNANAFSGQNDAPIYVPDESVDDYKTATNWVDLADRIFPISDKEVGGGSIDEVDGATTPIMLKTGSQETLDEDDTLKERELVYSSDKNIFGIYYDNKIRWQGDPLVIEPIIRVRSFGASDSKLSYVGMSPTLNLFQDGDINYYTNDVFDTMYPFRDMKEVEDELGNKFIEIPPFYVKYIVDENDIITGYDIANYKVDEDYGISPAFIDVISGEVKPLWFGKYMANVDGNNKMTSKSGVMATAEQTLDWFRQRAINNGLGYYQNSLYTWQIVQMLVWTYFGSINSDDFFPDINYGSYLNNGSMDSVPYKVAYDSTTGKNTFFGIENILKEKRHFIDGVLLNIPNMYVAKDFRKFATDTTTNYDLVSTSLPTSSGFIVSMAFENGVMYPKVVAGGSSGTYFADQYYQSTGNKILYGGSLRVSLAAYGLSAWNGINASSSSDANIGSRLMYSPLTPTE